tara:strand:- start:4597 stop:4881 length:285 start_codon:yes stop_codon:yes gene_type:complete
MNVKVLRMNTGEEVIFTLIEEDDNCIQVQNPLVAVPSPQGQVGFVPWSYLSKEDEVIDIPREYIVYVIEARDEIVENYEKIFSPIQTTSKKLIL